MDEPNKLKLSPEQLQAKIFSAQIQLMDPAFRQVQVHVPTDEIDMVDDGDSTILYARDLPMYEVRVDRFALPNVEVKGQWHNWPPPRPSKSVASDMYSFAMRRKAGASFSSIDGSVLD